MDEDVLRSFVDPLAKDAGVRRDGMRFAGAADPRDTMAAAAKLPNLDMPALLVWGVEDPFFTTGDARRLQGLIPDCRLVEIEGARTFTALDRPAEVAAAIDAFMAERPLRDAATARDAR